MKRKLLIIGMLALLSLSIVSAVYYDTGKTIADNFKDAKAYWTSYKSTREATIASASASIVYDGDEVCQIDYDSGDAYCLVKFNYTYSGEVYQETLVTQYGMAISEIDTYVEDYVKHKIKDLETIEDIKFKGNSLKGRSI